MSVHCLITSRITLSSKVMQLFTKSNLKDIFMILCFLTDVLPWGRAQSVRAGLNLPHLKGSQEMISYIFEKI